jgi:hypothetical protein
MFMQLLSIFQIFIYFKIFLTPLSPFSPGAPGRTLVSGPGDPGKPGGPAGPLKWRLFWIQHDAKHWGNHLNCDFHEFLIMQQFSKDLIIKRVLQLIHLNLCLIYLVEITIKNGSTKLF